MLCCICKEKEATVHLTQIAGHKMRKVDLCEECARTKGVNDPTGFSLADLLLGLGPSQGTSGSRASASDLSRFYVVLHLQRKGSHRAPQPNCRPQNAETRLVRGL